jgi:type VI secretion system protein ImpL
VRLNALLPKTTEGRYLAVAVFFLVLLASMTFIILKHPDMAGLQPDSEQQTHWLIAGGCVTGCALLASLLLLVAVRSAGKAEFDDLVDGTSGDDEKKKRETEKVAVHPAVVMCHSLRRHLYSRFGLFWRRKVRLLLVTGNEDAIDLVSISRANGVKR